MKKRVFFVRSNLADRDIRLAKLIETLKKENEYDITVICWNREGCSDSIYNYDNCQEVRLNLRTPWGIQSILFLPVWWLFVFSVLLRNRWDLVHAINFDCVVPCVCAGKIMKRPVIYEVLDIYEYQIVLPEVVKQLVVRIDKFFMKFVNAVVLADEEMSVGLGGIPKEHIVIYDSPPDDFNISPVNERNNDGFFRLFHAGALAADRKLNLDKVIAAIQGIDGVKLIVAGFGDQAEKIEELSKRRPDKIEFLGRISYEEVIKIGLKSDLFFALRDPIVPANKYTCGSTLFNAMICGKPILANRGSSTAAKVCRENCGIVVNALNIEEIKKAVVELKDNPDLRLRLGANGKQAYLSRYNWGIMENRLIGLYQQLLRQATDEEAEWRD